MLNAMDSDSAVPAAPLDPVPLPPDIVARIPKVFPGIAETVTQRLTQLQGAPDYFDEHIIRCIVFCVWRYHGSTLEHWIEQARTDYRDIIVAAEYERDYAHLRDLNRPFHDPDFETRPADI